jgi:hypothetical protein
MYQGVDSGDGVVAGRAVAEAGPAVVAEAEAVLVDLVVAEAEEEVQAEAGKEF